MDAVGQMIDGGAGWPTKRVSDGGTGMGWGGGGGGWAPHFWEWEGVNLGVGNYCAKLTRVGELMLRLTLTVVNATHCMYCDIH